MIYLQNAICDLNVNELKTLLLSSCDDFQAILDNDDSGPENNFVFYLDSGLCAVTNSEEQRCFKTWEEMLDVPLFQGKTLPEIVHRLWIYP